MTDLGLESGAVYDALHVLCAETASADGLRTFSGTDFRRMPPEGATDLVVLYGIRRPQAGPYRRGRLGPPLSGQLIRASGHSGVYPPAVERRPIAGPDGLRGATRDGQTPGIGELPTRNHRLRFCLRPQRPRPSASQQLRPSGRQCVLPGQWRPAVRALSAGVPGRF